MSAIASPEATPAAKGAEDSADFGPPQGEYTEAFAAIDGIDPVNRDPAPRREEQPQRRESPKPDDTPAPKETKKPDPKPEKPDKPAEAKKTRSLGDDLDGILNPSKPQGDDKGKDDGKVDESAFEAPETPKQLREAFKTVKQRAAEHETKVRELETKLQEAETRVRTALESEYKPRIEAAEKRRSELESELRFLDYSKSEEYKEKYEGPLKQAWEAVASDFKGQMLSDGEGGEMEFDLQHMVALMRMANPQARKAADAMFGSAAAEAMRHRADLLRLTGQREKALDEWRERGSQRQAESQRARQEMVKRWESDFDSYRSEQKELFGHRDGDTEGNTLIDRGVELVHRAMLAKGIPEGLTPEQRQEAIMDAQTKVSLRAMAYTRTHRDLVKARSEIEKLQTKLKQYEKSEPIPGDDRGRGSSGGKPEYTSPEDEIDNLPAARSY